MKNIHDAKLQHYGVEVTEENKNKILKKVEKGSYVLIEEDILFNIEVGSGVKFFGEKFVPLDANEFELIVIKYKGSGSLQAKMLFKNSGYKDMDEDNIQISDLPFVPATVKSTKKERE